MDILTGIDPCVDSLNKEYDNNVGNKDEADERANVRTKPAERLAGTVTFSR
jgi:hypothetical protein